jgi:hypothetical protein
MGKAISPRGDMPKNRVRVYQGRSMSRVCLASSCTSSRLIGTLTYPVAADGVFLVWRKYSGGRCGLTAVVRDRAATMLLMRVEGRFGIWAERDDVTVRSDRDITVDVSDRR